MNFRRTFAVVVMVITGFASCAMLPRHGNNYFTESEKEVFKASAAGLGLYTGYDSDLSLNYIFKREQRASVPDQAAFNKSFEEFDNDMLVAYFLKLYSIQVSVEYLELYYKITKNGPCIIT